MQLGLEMETGIYSDSQAALKANFRPLASLKLVEVCRDTLEELPRTKVVKLREPMDEKRHGRCPKGPQ